MLELSKFRVDTSIVGFFLTSGRSSGEISSGKYTYISAMNDDTRGTSRHLQLNVAIEERLMMETLKHKLGFISRVVIYAPRDVWNWKLDVLRQARLCIRPVSSRTPSLIWLTSVLRLTLWELVWNYGFSTRDTKSSLLNFARSKRLKNAGSYYQRPGAVPSFIYNFLTSFTHK